jgi:MSHA biogenesis protein MshN
VVPHPVSQPVATSALQVPHKVPLVKTPPLQIKTPTTQSVSAVAVTSKAPDLRPTEPAVPIKKKPDSGNTDTSALKQVSPAQRADAEFHKATGLMQQGRVNEAIDGYEEALRLDAGHNASRQTLVTLLLEAKRNADAERVLKQGQEIKPEHTGFAMLLARIQVEHGALDQAIATLKKSLPYAEGQANYQAFLAALLQRNNLHNDAIIYYQIALRITPGNGIWLMGCGISLQAVKRNDDARQSYQRALDSKTLSPELQAFVRQKLKEL